MQKKNLLALVLSALLGGCVTGDVKGTTPFSQQWVHKSREQRQTRPDEIMGRPLYTTPGEPGGRGDSPYDAGPMHRTEPASPGGSLRDRVSW